MAENSSLTQGTISNLFGFGGQTIRELSKTLYGSAKSNELTAPAFLSEALSVMDTSAIYRQPDTNHSFLQSILSNPAEKIQQDGHKILADAGVAHANILLELSDADRKIILSALEKSDLPYRQVKSLVDKLKSLGKVNAK